ncbi:flagellar biosynthetic protein FliP [Acidothermus cellulolyticus 11B]|uniref:Flagellar biosynthetic protein FliP n=1 Tax=Acidothermus cellulolyticus (strain ATCC 43068 / DSM 8971 / 11B) TaxID=351607 RepID=A0LT70_ACIC1|nr:flagellar type III secretion system pore protein FliP [Acidothermus cellulolyticus]ABK52630.1 flagellar biosynthetic protein FliP [Acidothermus cellulolyticus 11B]
MDRRHRRRVAGLVSLAVGAGVAFAVALPLAAGASGAQALAATPAAASAPAQSPAPFATPSPIPSIAPITPIATGPAAAAPTPSGPAGPTGPAAPNGPGSTVTVSINGVNGKPSQSIVIILLMTVLAVAPAALILTTSFTKVIVVLSLTRNALGLQTIPPNQVLVGLALFLSLFVMSPTLSAMNKDAVQPYLKGHITASQAYDAGVQPLKTFMLNQTRKDDLALMIDASHQSRPASPKDVSMTTLVPAFVLSELRAAFIIGFVIFVPFLIIDLVVSSSLMSMGMMMLPPSIISLPFKLLLFIMVDGWGLIARTLLSSYH